MVTVRMSMDELLDHETTTLGRRCFFYASSVTEYIDHKTGRQERLSLLVYEPEPHEGSSTLEKRWLLHDSADGSLTGGIVGT